MVVASIFSAVLACTGFYVGKGVSTDGTVLLGRTADFHPWTNCARLDITPRVENRPGRVCRGVNGCEWPLPATTWKFVSTPMHTSLGQGRYDSACVNEKGLAITGTVTGRNQEWIAEADPYVKNGFGESALPGLLAQCCTTARGAVEMLGEVVAKVGHNGREIYMFADRDEAWYVEVYTGHQWAAVRMPEDAVACYGNQFMLREIDPAADGTLCSSDLIGLAERKGRLVRGARGFIDPAATYGRELVDYGNYRTWYGHNVMAPSTAGVYCEQRAMPLFFRPDRQIGYRDIFELMRTRYEGSGRCPEETGNTSVRVIGTTKQATCHVISLDGRLPEDMRGTIWVTMANAEHGVFLPINASATALAEGYGEDQLGGEFRYDGKLAGMVFRRLATLAELDRRWYGAGVRKYWRNLEEKLLGGYAAALGSHDRTRIGEFCVAAQSGALADARRMFDDLMWYASANNRISGDGNKATDQPPAPFAFEGK